MERVANLLGALGLALADGERETIAAASGLSVIEAAALNRIGVAPGGSIRHVSDVVGITHPGAVRVIDRLVALGLVERRPGIDGRTLGLHLTPSGAARWEAQTAARQAWLNELVARLPRHGGDGFERAVEKLLGALTVDERQAEHVCRLCNETACPQDICPVTLAAVR